MKSYKKKKLASFAIAMIMFSCAVGIKYGNLQANDEAIAEAGTNHDNIQQGQKDEVNKQSTDEKYFIFGKPNTITGYSSSGDAPKDVIIPDTYTDSNNIVQEINYIDKGAFSGKGIQTITFNSKLSYIGSNAFSNNAISELLIPGNIETIMDSAFAENMNLNKVIVEAGVKTIGKQAFYNCQSLQSIELPKTMHTISEALFMNCNNLTSITLPENLKEIEASAFENCKGLANVILPDTITKIGEAAFMNSGLTSIALPTKLEQIEDHMFTNSTLLAEVFIPEGVKGIGLEAFSNTNLKTISLPDSLAVIKESAFSGSGALQEITIGTGITSIGKEAFTKTANGIKVKLYSKTVNSVTGAPWGASYAQIYWKTDDDSCFYFDDQGVLYGFKPSDHENCPTNDHTVADIPAVINGITITSIADQAFSNNDDLHKVVLPKTITKIGSEAFRNCSELNSLTLSEGLLEIGSQAFTACINLKAVTIPDTVSVIKEAAFDSTGLTSIELPESLTVISSRLFRNCKNLTSFQISSNVTTISELAFSGCNITKVELPDQVQRVENAAFSDNVKLEEVIIGEQIQYIGEDAFARTLDGIKIRLETKKVNSIAGSPWGASKAQIYWYSNDDSCFYIDDKGVLYGFKPLDHEGCDQIGHTEVNIPERINGIQITRIAKNAFKRNNDIIKLYMPDTINVIDESAFEYCQNLKDIVLSQNLTLINHNAFSNCVNITSIELPDSVTELGEQAFYYCNQLSSFKISKESQLKTIQSRAFAYNTSLTGILLPKHVYKLENEVFYGDRSLKIVESESGLQEIGAGAFKECKVLEQLLMPATLTEAGDEAFSYCQNLKDISFAKNLKNVNYRTFYNCGSIVSMKFEATLLSIGNEAFADCSKLTSINFPEGLKNIGEYVIDGTDIQSDLQLPSSLETMTRSSLSGYKGSKIYVNMLRANASQSLNDSIPWGAYEATIYWLGEYTSANLTVAYSKELDYATIHMEVTAQIGGYITTIELPNGEQINNIDTNQHTFDYHVNKNDNYQFVVHTDNGETRSFVIATDKIIYIQMQASDFSIVGGTQDTLTKDIILEKAYAEAYWNPVTDLKNPDKDTEKKKLDIEIKSPSLDEIKKQLDGFGKEVSVTLQSQGSFSDDPTVYTKEKVIKINTDVGYEVSYLDHDNKVLITQKVVKGEHPIDPVKSDQIDEPRWIAHKFIGWCDVTDIKCPVDLDDSVDFDDIVVESNMTFKTKYKDMLFQVNYDLAGGKSEQGEEIENKTNVKWTDKDLLLDQTIIKRGYTFTGWALKLKSTDYIVTNDKSYACLAYIINNDNGGDADAIDGIKEITLVAQWKLDTHYIKFDLNGATSGTRQDIAFSVESPSVIIQGDQFEKIGFVFKGWSVKQYADSEDELIYEGAKYIPPPLDPEIEDHEDMPIENITLYAQWEVQDASVLVSIPKELRLKNDEEQMIATISEKVKIVEFDEITQPFIPDKDIWIKCNPNIVLRNSETIDNYKVDVYDQLGNQYKIPQNPEQPVPEDPLMILNPKQEDMKEAMFTLKTMMNNYKYRGEYTGKMMFYISFKEERTK